MADPVKKLVVPLPPLPLAAGERPVSKVKLTQPGIVKIRRGDSHGGGQTELRPDDNLAIAELPDGSIVLSGSRVVRLPPHRVLEVEYGPALSVAGKK